METPAATRGRAPDWARVQEFEESERRRELPYLDTTAAISQFRLAWQVAMADPAPRELTGLVEQQRLFAVLRPCKT
jgi:hypothetical protein